MQDSVDLLENVPKLVPRAAGQFAIHEFFQRRKLLATNRTHLEPDLPIETYSPNSCVPSQLQHTTELQQFEQQKSVEHCSYTSATFQVQKMQPIATPILFETYSG